MLIGQTIGPFTVEKEIGSGAMGTVYKAKFSKDGKILPVALKVISFGLAGNEGALARFDREASILKQLRHPNIVRLYATGRYKQTPFIAMEYVDGEALDRVLARRGRLPWEDVANYGKQLAGALQHAHDKGIVHRDLKPSNLMVTPAGVLKLTDFGIAKDDAATALTGANSTIGTAAYMSPEQCKGEKTLGPKSDLYSLGIVFYELLTGKKPFAADSTIDMFLKHVNETAVRPSRLVPDLPVWMDNLVMFLLEKGKDNRPLDAATVGRMIADIEAKVQDQRSVGAEVANARKVDRPLGSGTAGRLDDADRAAARSLRGGKKRKKKAKPWYQQTWVKAAGIGAGLLAVGAVVFAALRPEGLDAAYARIEKADGAEAKVEAAAKFLATYGTAADPKVEQARTIFREARTREAEAVLQKRFATKFRANSEGFDEDAFKTAMTAMDAEKSGELKRAADLWASVRERQPPPDPAKFTDEAAVGKGVLGWVAEKRLKEIRQDVPEEFKKLQEQVAAENRLGVVREYDGKTPEGMALRGLRLESVGDPAKAKAAWEAVVGLTDKEPDRRAWFLLAGQQAAQITLKKDDDPRPERLRRLEQRIAKLTADWERVKDDPENLVGRRDVRNGCRDIAVLYDDDPNENVKGVVAQAKKLLAANPK